MRQDESKLKKSIFDATHQNNKEIGKTGLRNSQNLQYQQQEASNVVRTQNPIVNLIPTFVLFNCFLSRIAIVKKNQNTSTVETVI